MDGGQIVFCGIILGFFSILILRTLYRMGIYKFPFLGIFVPGRGKKPRTVRRR
jgi:hypothetical protein